jgi:hypothetical protein
MMTRGRLMVWWMLVRCSGRVGSMGGRMAFWWLFVWV